MDQDFEDHLRKLYDAYAPDMENVPTSDEILSGSRKFDPALGFDVRYQVGLDVVDELVAIWQKYGCKTNILFESKTTHFFEFLSVLEPELQIALIRLAIARGITFRYHGGSTLAKFLDEYVVLLSGFRA